MRGIVSGKTKSKNEIKIRKKKGDSNIRYRGREGREN